MITKIKKCLVSFLSIAMLLMLLSNTSLRTSALGDITIDGDTISISNQDFGYSGTVKTLYSDETIHKYEITEFNESYTLLLDVESDAVLVNDRKMTFDEFLDLTEIQLSRLKSKTDSYNKSIVMLSNHYSRSQNDILKYDTLHSEYVKGVKNHFHNQNVNTRCMHCLLNTTEVPKTNYKSKEYNIGSKSNKMEIAMTSVIIAAFAAYCTWGLSAVASACIAGFLELISVSVAFAQVDYHAYQSFHDVCWNAVKERRKIWMRDTNSGKVYSVNKYNYFYSSKPF